MHPQIILASASPRRKQLLQQIGIQAHCIPVDIDETKLNNESPLQYCQRLALEKAQTGYNQSNKDTPVLGADTIVVFDNHTLGKPKDEKDAFTTLAMLSDKTHQVITAIAIVNREKMQTSTSISTVKFSNISDNEILKYIETKEPFGKAGSYAIQGIASIWIESIQGSYSGIMGLPLFETAGLLKKFDVETL
jgi:septum formation protein